MLDAKWQYLKKVLALVMAFAMAFTMMAGAAYTDQADITATEAVDTLAALNIMTGDTDGSFRPNDTVTRAEMCRMIYSIRNQGKSDASAYAKMQTTFTDVGESAWFSGYVKYCQSVGIVSGRSKTIFDPNAKVTGVEAALMCLRVMGYDPAKAGIGGSSWSMTTIGLADENGLLDDVNCTLTTDLPRQYAAQIMYNMIFASTVKWSNDSESYTDVGSNNEPNETVGAKYLNLIETKGILSSVKWNSNDKVYKTKVGKEVFDSSKDYSSAIGREVKALSKEVKNETVLYGVFATDKNNTATFIYDDAKIDGKTVTVDGEDYDLANDFKTIATNGEVIKSADYDDWDNYAYLELTLVDNNNDDKYEFAVVNPFKVAQVTSLTAKKAYFENVLDDTDTYNSDVDDLDSYEKMAEDDYVLLTEAAYSVSGNMVAVKAETVSGKVSGTKSDGSIKVDGTWYKKAADDVDVPSNGDELDSAVVVNGFYCTTEGTTGSTDKLALVLKVGDQEFDGDYRDVKLLLSDGTTKTTKAYVKDGSDKNAPVLKTLYTYTENNTGYVLKAIADGEDIGMDKDVIKGTADVKYNSQTNKIDGKRLAADAQVFVLYEKSADGNSYKGKVVTGADADKWANGDYWFTVAYTDGNVKLMVASVAGADMPNATDDSLYGVILSEPYTDKDEDDNDIVVIEKFLTEDGVVSIKVDADEFDMADLLKNMLVTYKMDGSDYVEFAKNPTNATAIVGAVTDVDGDYVTVKSESSTVELKIDEDDSTVLSFDSDAGDVANGSIKEATKKDKDNYYANIMVVYKTAEEEDGSHIIWGAAADINNQLLNDADDEITVSVN